MDLLGSMRARIERGWAARGDLLDRWPHEGSRGLVKRVEAAVDRRWMGGPGVSRPRGNPPPAFDALGRLVEARWRARGFAVSELSSVALAALRDSPPDIDPSDIVRWVSHEAEMPWQDVGGAFADFQVQVYSHHRFYIEALFWVNGATTIHQHSFTGAFHVLRGSSVHAQWDFDLRERLDAGLLAGGLRQRNIEFLQTGDTRPIALGDAFIHSLFHLERPSVTIVVRTHSLPRALPQYAYLPSGSGLGLGVDPNLKRTELRRKLGCLALLLETQPASLDDFMREAISTEDASGATALLRAFNNRAPDFESVQKQLAHVRARFGALAGVLEPVLAQHRVTAAIVAMRGKLSDPELRFFLALLLNARARPHVHALIRARYPERDPETAVIAWLRAALAAEPDFAGRRLDAEEQSMLELLAAGHSPEAIAASAASHPALRATDPSHIAARCRELAATPRLRALLTA